MSELASDKVPVPDAETLARFIEIVGPGNAVMPGADMAPYLEEPRGIFEGASACVLRPGSTAEVSRILELASRTRTAIVPQGGNTGMVGGQTPRPSGAEIVVQLGRMDRVRAVDPATNSMTVEAGLTLARAQEVAAEHDRLFPLSLSSEGTCQVGGNLATNAGGTAVLAYGNARSLALGLEVVLADGRVWNGLKALRKDNTGYDLKDLFIGSEGTLGIITAATLALYPRPAARATAFVAVAGLDRALELLHRGRALAGSQVVACEVIPRIGIEFLLRHGPGLRDPLADPAPWYVLLELAGAGTDEALATRLEDLLSAGAEAGTLQDAVVARSLAQARELWRLREMMSEIQKHEGGSIKHDISVPIAHVPELVERASAAAEAIVPSIRPVPFGHLGDGNIHFNLSQPPDMDRRAFLAKWDEISEAVHAIVIELGGSISAEHGIGQLKRDALTATADPVGLDLMRSLKRTLDPLGILNPGKLL